MMLNSCDASAPELKLFERMIVESPSRVQVGVVRAILMLHWLEVAATVLANVIPSGSTTFILPF